MVAADRVLDAKGLRCPLPLLKAKKALNELAQGEVLEVQATDPGSERDFKVFVAQSSHTLLGFEKRGDLFYYWIKRGA